MASDRGNAPTDRVPLSATVGATGVVDRAWPRDWFDAPNAIFRPGLSLSVHARLVYVYLSRRNADRGRAFPGYTRMAADCGVSRRTAIHAVQELSHQHLADLARVRGILPKMLPCAIIPKS